MTILSNAPRRRRHIVLALALTTIYWGSQWLLTDTIAAQLSARSAIVPPLVLAGRQLPLALLVEEPILRSTTAAGYIMLLSSDDCGICRASLPTWERVIGTSTVEPRAELLFVSVSGDDIPSRLALAAQSAGLRHQVLRIANTARFSRTTGIAWTPHVLALTREMRVVATSKELSEATFAHFVQKATGG